ncbi:MAG: rod shape-determining protein [Eubacteriales bacterium]|nr:rod shape-determining protein [Eubacteriales bacterium]
MPVTDIGIDLGTATIIVYVKGKGILYQEPSLVVFDRDANKILAFGTEAEQILGRTPGNIVGIHPLKGGVISDFRITERMLRYFIRKSMGLRNILKPRICICVPSGITAIEKKTVEEAAYRGGAREAVIVREPLVAAMGAGIDIMRPSGNMVINIGGDVTEIAVLSLGGIVISQTLKTAGTAFDRAIAAYVRRNYGVIITEQQAEEIKISIGSADDDGEDLQMEIEGRDADAGFPQTVVLNSEMIREAVAEPLHVITESVRGIIEKTPPDLANDVAERGIVLTGGGAMLAGLETALEKATGIRTMLAENPQQAVALGTGLYIQQMSEFEKRRL